MRPNNCVHPRRNPIGKMELDWRGRRTHKRACDECGHVEVSIEVPANELRVYEMMVDRIDEFTARFGENSMALLLHEKI